MKEPALGATGLRLLLVVLLGAVTSSLLATSAAADEWEIQILSPEAESTVTWYYPHAEIDFGTTPTTTDLELNLLCDLPDGNYKEYPSIPLGAGLTGTHTLRLGRLPQGVGCYVSIDDVSGGTYTGQAFYTHPVLALEGLQVVYGQFYPYRRDGIRDSQLVRFRFNREASYRLAVLDSAGKVVRTSPYAKAESGSWYWDGRRNDGRWAATGAYRVYIKATVEGKTVSRTSGVFYLRSGYVYERIDTQSKDGSAGSPATKGQCWIYQYDSTSEVDCWGGEGYLRYYFRVPAEASKFGFNVVGEKSRNDACCNGTVQSAGTRTNATTYRVTVKVNGTRAWLFHRVDVHSYRKVLR